MNEQLRRRSVGSPAARSMLLTILGEYLLPREGDGVWQEALVGALVDLGYSSPAARQAVVRSTRDGWLDAERCGRRARMRLTEGTARLLSEGSERIYSFGRVAEWDGRWLLVAVRVPEHSRDLRHQLRTKLAWAGFGSLGGGLWLTPHTDREPEVLAAANALPGAGVISFHAEVGAVGDAVVAVQEAWDLDAVAEQYRAFVADFSPARPATPAEAFHAQTLMVHAWRKFPFIDPDLPESLLPAQWPKEGAHGLFHACHGRWRDEAAAHFEALCEGSGDS